MEMNEKEMMLIGYTTSRNNLIIEGYNVKGEYNISLVKKKLEKYDEHIEIDLTELGPEEIYKSYNMKIDNRELYISIFTRDNNNAKIQSMRWRYPLRHVICLLFNKNSHVIMFSGKDVEVDISSDYYYGDKSVITSSEVTSLR